MQKKEKYKNKKTKLTLSINGLSINRGKEVAEISKVSLSQLTENLYDESFKKMKQLQETPEIAMRDIERQIEGIRDVMSNKKKEDQNQD